MCGTTTAAGLLLVICLTKHLVSAEYETASFRVSGVINFGRISTNLNRAILKILKKRYSGKNNWKERTVARRHRSRDHSTQHRDFLYVLNRNQTRTLVVALLIQVTHVTIVLLQMFLDQIRSEENS